MGPTVGPDACVSSVRPKWGLSGALMHMRFFSQAQVGPQWGPDALVFFQPGPSGTSVGPCCTCVSSVRPKWGLSGALMHLCFFSQAQLGPQWDPACFLERSNSNV